MKTVFKYALKITDEQQILMPKGATPLSVGIDNNGGLSVWALVDTAAPKHVRVFRVAGTGHEIPHRVMWNFLGTVMAYPFVWHVFVFAYEGGEVEIDEVKP